MKNFFNINFIHETLQRESFPITTGVHLRMTLSNKEV